MVFGLTGGKKQHVLIGTRPGVQSTSASLKCVGAGGETLGAGGVRHRGGYQLHGGGHDEVDAKLALGKRDSRASRHPAVQGVEAGSQVRSGEAPPSGDKGVWTRMVTKSSRGQRDGVQHVQRSAEHKGATRNAPWHGLGLGFEARGMESGRQATKEPKRRASPRRENDQKWKRKKPDEKESLIPLTWLRLAGEDPLATETHTGQPRPPVIKQQGTTKGSDVRPWTGLWTPPPNGNGAAVTIGCARATTTRSELPCKRRRGRGQSRARGKGTPAPLQPGW